MASIETLEILIEADSRGLETQLKRAGENVLTFVNKLNAKEVNWSDILTKSLTPTVVGFIATSLAVGISSALRFQTALITAGQNASEGFKDNMGAVSGSLLGTAKSSVYSSEEIASAFGIVNSTFKDTKLATGLLAEITDVATARHTDLLETTKLLVPLMEAWGVTTIPQAEEALSKLNYATKLGSIGFEDLVRALTDTGAVLSTKTNLSLGDTALQLESIQNKTGMTANAVTDTFKKISDAVAVPGSNLEVLTVGFGKMGSTIDTAGITGAFKAIDERIYGTGITGKLLAQEMGLVNDAIAKFGSTAPALFDAAGKAAEDAASRIPTITQQANEALTETDKLKKLWNSFSADLTETFMPAVVGVSEFFLQFLDDATNGFQDFADLIEEGSWAHAFVEAFKAMGESMQPVLDKVAELNTSIPESIGTSLGLTDLFQNMMDQGPSVKANVPAPHADNSSTDKKASNVTIHNTYNISAPPGGEKNLGEHISNQMNQLSQGTNSSLLGR